MRLHRPGRSFARPVLPGPNPQLHSEIRVGGGNNWKLVATGQGFEKNSPRNKCVQDVFPLPEDFRALLGVGTGDFIRRPPALKASTWMTFVKIVRLGMQRFVISFCVSSSILGPATNPLHLNRDSLEQRPVGPVEVPDALGHKKIMAQNGAKLMNSSGKCQIADVSRACW
ncbi:hypothetical protein BTVI_96662 [Pitangus sulphuratus]|nr:hypothetical protein BTVI_96662 [Pitangus sulphuratus]